MSKGELTAKLKIAVLVSGGGTNLQAVIDAIESGQIKNSEIVLVVSTNSKAYSLERAKKHGIGYLVLSKKMFPDSGAHGGHPHIDAREAKLLEALRQKDVDLVVFSGCLMVLSPAFIGEWGKPIINIHPSLLPAYGGKGFYGIAVHEAVLAANEKTTGATVHYIDGGIDTGDIIIQKEVAIKEGDTPQTLQKRVLEEAEWVILPKAVAMFAEAYVKRMPLNIRSIT
jgi:phosphoribosylglycinamide formyltransferase-1